MRLEILLGLTFVVSSCGGKETSRATSANDPTSDAGDSTLAVGDSTLAVDARASVAGIGPIDASGLPSELAMICEGKAQLALKLPCAVGLNLVPPRDSIGFNATECELSSQAELSATPARPAMIALLIPLGTVVQRLNQPLTIPGDIVLAPTPGFALEGEDFTVATIEATAIFSQVDPARAFVGRLQNAKIDWQGAQGGTIVCNATDQPFWAVAGRFE